MTMLMIFYDDIKKVKNIIDKIKKESKSRVQEINIYDYLKNPNVIEICSNDVAYFLFNNTLSALLANKLNRYQCKVLNKEFFLKKFDKEKVQRLLLKNKINVPKIIDISKITNQKLICKSKNHTLPVNIFESNEDLNKFMANKNNCEFYAEEFIEKDAEYKIYYVNGKMFFYENIEPIYDKLLNKSFEKIGKILKLDIFSADVLFKDGKFFVIDINPATGLFLSKNARRELLGFLKQ